jgi:hypothetical protein
MTYEKGTNFTQDRTGEETQNREKKQVKKLLERIKEPNTGR